MDPITLWICILATGWVLRSLVEDGFAAVRGQPSPRIARRRARQQLAHEHTAATGTPPLTTVISTRLAKRITDPPERRAWAEFRRYVDDVLADAWEDARTHHEQRRRQRAATAAQASTAGDTAGDTCGGSRRAPEGGPQAGEPAEDDGPIDVEWFPTEDHQADDAAAAAVDADADADAEQPERPASPQPPTRYPEQPPILALPAPQAPITTTWKDSAPVSHPNTINGDVGSPSEALAFCENTLDLNRACANELDVALANLRAAGCGQNFLNIITGGLRATDEFHSGVVGARVRYARHVVAQADLSSDPDLRNTLLGYLSADRA